MSFRYLLKCHLLVEAFFDHAIENKTLWTCSVFPSSVPLFYLPHSIYVYLILHFDFFFFVSSHQNGSSVTLDTLYPTA